MTTRRIWERTQLDEDISGTCLHNLEASGRAKFFEDRSQLRDAMLRLGLTTGDIISIQDGPGTTCFYVRGMHYVDNLGYYLVLRQGEHWDRTPIGLPIVRFSGKQWFRDERLREYRNVKDPWDRVTFEAAP